MAEEEMGFDAEELQRKVEEQLKEISDGDQSRQALLNLASQAITFFQGCLEALGEDGDPNVALSLTQTYVETVIHTMLGR